MKKLFSVTGTLFLCIFYTCTCAAASPEIVAIQRLWAQASYQMEGDDQEQAMKMLIDDCQNLISSRPDNAEALVWCGIVKSSYAGIKGGISALKYAKAARDDLEKAIVIEPDVLAGSALSSLGTLYSKVPGWPLGFGNEKKASQLLLAGVEASPDGIDSNYFYAEFLYENDELQEARTHLQRAQRAQPRLGRSVADDGRRAEITKLLEIIEAELNED